jgi:hypothetical protein
MRKILDRANDISKDKKFNDMEENKKENYLIEEFKKCW